jgi:hypothetical protein
VKSAINKLDWNPQAAQRAEGVADMVGDQYAKKYGTWSGFKNELSENPAGILADASTVLTGGATVLPKAAMLSKAAAAVDPLMIAAKAGGKVLEGTGFVGKTILGNTTGAGSEALQQAYSAGKQGGETAKALRDNMRGKAEFGDVIDVAQNNLTAMKIKKNQEYKSGMIDISNDKSVLSFDDIDKALGRASEFGQYKGQVTNPEAAQAVAEAAKIVNNWKKLDPAEFHTPEGMDKLKQTVGSILEKIPLEQRQTRMAVDNIYNAIGSQIRKDAPTYDKVMADYGEANALIKEIEKALSLGPKGKFSADTAMRKLQSLMRNNANTNYGNRLDLANQLEAGGGQQILPALAGQSLNTLTPRGLQQMNTGTAGLGLAGYSLGIPGVVGAAAISSPRVAGEAAYGTGQLARMLREGRTKVDAASTKTNVNPRILANLLYQMNQTTNDPNR